MTRSLLVFGLYLIPVRANPLRAALGVICGITAATLIYYSDSIATVGPARFAVDAAEFLLVLATMVLLFNRRPNA